MAQIGKISEKMELKCSGKQFYEFWKNKMECIYEMFPAIIKSYTIVEGNGISHGSVIHLKCDLGSLVEMKERVSMDDVNKVVTMEVIEGDLSSVFEMIKFKMQVFDNGSNGSSVNWTIEFVKANENVATPHNYFPYAAKITKGIDEYLCNN